MLLLERTQLPFQLETLEWSQNRKNRTMRQNRTQPAGYVGSLVESIQQRVQQVGPEKFGNRRSGLCKKAFQMVLCDTTDGVIIEQHRTSTTPVPSKRMSSRFERLAS